jgi:hypothetical protein
MRRDRFLGLSSLVLVLAACSTPPAHPGDDAGTSRDAGAIAATDGGTDAGAATDAGPARAHDVLFVGNSYIYVNDVRGHYEAIAPGGRVEEVTQGGYTLAQHAADARTDGTELARWLRTGTAEETSFDVVVLQEQSQIGGFPSGAFYRDRTESIAGALELGELARARGARVVLYHTWGREHGDPELSLLGFGTFLGMQERLDAAYLALASLLREAGVDVAVAPVGGAFRIVFDDVVRAGGDPLAEGSDFDALYEPDGSHPSPQGAYLAACVIAGTISGEDARGFVDEAELGAETSTRLRDACARALAEPRWYVPAIVRADAPLSGRMIMGERFGAAVALSADASRLVVGNAGWPGVESAASVFARDGSAWSEEARLVSDASSVALSADGTRALSGAAIVYSRDGATWAEEWPIPPGPGELTGSARAFALSADGSRAVEATAWDGGPDGPRASARIFVRSAGAWSEEAVFAATTDALWVQYWVAMDGAGERVILSDGVTRVLARGEEGWSEEAVLAEGIRRVAISADGTHALVAGDDRDTARVFVRSGTSWAEVATLRGPPSSGFGAAMALSADGTRALLGTVDDRYWTTTGSGTARLFLLRDGRYREEVVIVPSGVGPLDGGSTMFGESVALNAEGTTAAIGAPMLDAGTQIAVGVTHVVALP